MTTDIASKDPRLLAIRKDPVVGRGSCSAIDECMTDLEVCLYLDKDGVKHPSDALWWARKNERLHLERGCEQRWGVDDDPQLLALREFEASCRENPIVDLSEFDVPQEDCPNCGTHHIFIDEDAPHVPRRQTCKCDKCSFRWNEPCESNELIVEIQYDAHSLPDFPKILRMLADEIEKTNLDADSWGDLPKYQGSSYRGSWAIKRDT